MFMGVIVDPEDEGHQKMTGEDRVTNEIERLLNNLFTDVNHDG